MNPLTRLADASLRGDLKRTKTSRERWRELALRLGKKLRAVTAALIRQRGQIAHQNRIIQDQSRAIARMRRHLDACPTAQAIADHDADKARSNA